MIKVFYLISVVWNGQSMVLGDATQMAFDTLIACEQARDALEMDQPKYFPGSLGYHQCLLIDFSGGDTI